MDSAGTKMGCRSLLVLILTASFVLGVTNGQGEVISKFMCVGLPESCDCLSDPGLGFVLNNVSYPNGSSVLRIDIGEIDAALQCTTDRVGCCTGKVRAGEFYFPDGTQVPNSNSKDLTRTYYRNRISGAIRLNRRPTGTITGQFRCEIPDASGTLVNLIINVGI